MLTNQKAGLAQLKVKARAIEKNIVVSEPILDTVYDLILDIEGVLYKVQVKYADGSVQNSEGSITCGLKKKSHGKFMGYTRDDIDAILVYIPKIDKILWFDPEYFENKKQFVIRIEAAKNSQRKGILFADNFIW
jgi:hypothetical protein